MTIFAGNAKFCDALYPAKDRAAACDFLARAGLRHLCPFPRLDGTPGDRDWNLAVVAQAR